ncbi:MAG: hypothetical protein ACI85H_001701 [Paracoccaceae bacterium]|jgi:hypothetical protein
MQQGEIYMVLTQQELGWKIIYQKKNYLRSLN